MLKFIGTGSYNNYKLGNNCAYIKSQGVLILFDCGHTTFDSLRKLDMLKDLEDVYVCITHKHDDHIGSLPTLAYHCYYELGISIGIISQDDYIQDCLLLLGITDTYYTLFNQPSFTIAGVTITPKVTKHQDVWITNSKGEQVNAFKCYGYYVNYNGTTCYYSGDSAELSNVVLNELKTDKIQLLYQDVSITNNEVHLSFDDLCRLIPEKSLRSKIWCMHLEPDFKRQFALDCGFNVVDKIVQ